MTATPKVVTPMVKICGVTRVGDAERAVALGADLIGLNFYPPSPRCLEVAAARELSRAIGDRALKVGVFVDRPRREIAELDARVGLDLIQLHGDEDPDEVDHWGGRALQVLRLPATRREPLPPETLAPWPRVWGFLFDVEHPAYGGSGVSWNYDTLAALGSSWGGPPGASGVPLLVAGGVAPGSARRALAASGATGVDVCSGVESAPGIKDMDLMKQLFEEVGRGPRP
ncbi:MAG: phosphoribosylanthranilate isomerase [Acidobacteriota bacterium]